MIPTLLLLWACGEEPVDTAGTGSLPDETGEIEVRYDTSTYALESGVPADTANEDPETTLLLQQTGTWNLSPAGGPYTAMSGDLVVLETYVESGRTNCSATYNLSGSSTSEACETCSVAFLVTFTFAEGNTSPCRDTDLPALDEQRKLGWAPEEETIYLDYDDLGTWIPWYDASAEGDALHVRWEATVGVVEGS